MKRSTQIKTGLAALLCVGLTGMAQAGDQSKVLPPSHLVLLAQAGTSYPMGDQQTDTQKEKSKTDQNALTTDQPTACNKASKLIGMSVQNQQGDKLGDIKDLVIDPKTSKVSYAVLATGGVLGMGEKLLAVPLSAFSRGTDQTHLVLNADKSNIAQAEGIRDNWPSVKNPSFGAMPFWQQSDQQGQRQTQEQNQKKSENKY